jgi:RNAse (barnase) inhibitor barstar
MSFIFNIPTQYYSENNVRYVFIDGNTCTNITECYNSLQQQLSLPDYFGYNLDALEEVLSDLDWIEEEKIKVILLNSEKLLSDNKEKKKAFLDILNSCKNEKMEIIYLAHLSGF